MYKYIHNNQTHEALGFLDARKHIGRTLPEHIDPVSHFIVRLWKWQEADCEFSAEIFDPPGHQVFNKYDEALACFLALERDYPDNMTDDFRLELVQYHLGEIHVLQSKILFPPILAREL